MTGVGTAVTAVAGLVLAMLLSAWAVVAVIVLAVVTGAGHAVSAVLRRT